MSSKGLSALVSIVFVILLGITMIAIVFSSLGKIQIDILTKASGDQMSAVARDLGEQIVSVYKSVKASQITPAINNSVLVKEVSIRLPEKLGGANYKIDLEEPQDVLLGISTFTIDGQELNSTTNRPTSRIVATSGKATVSQRIYNVDIGLQGSSRGGEERLRGYIYDYNGNVREKIILGQDTILIGIDSLKLNQSGTGCGSKTNITVEGHALYTTGGLFNGTARATILENNDFAEKSANPEFLITFCSDLSNQTEYTALINLVDPSGNAGFLRKKLLA